MKKQNQKSKRGISLIVLVITIIVIIILAAAIILSMDNNNPIENAKKAKEEHNLSVYQEELELYAINEYSNRNNEGFNKNALNAFNGYNVKKIITSMLDEDVDKYIIWQGKLVKKDGDVYKYIDGQEVKMFGENGKVDEQETLTENRVNFAKEFEKIQEGITNEKERLIYNGGYITNCADYTSESSYNFYTTAKFKKKLPENVVIKSYNLRWDNEDSWWIGTDNKIFYSGSDELLAKTVFYGDVDITEMFGMNNNDSSIIQNIYYPGNPKDKYSSAAIIAADVTGDGMVNKSDYTIVSQNYGNISKVVNQNRPAIMPSY